MYLLLDIKGNITQGMYAPKGDLGSYKLVPNYHGWKYSSAISMFLQESPLPIPLTILGCVLVASNNH